MSRKGETDCEGFLIKILYVVLVIEHIYLSLTIQLRLVQKEKTFLIELIKNLRMERLLITNKFSNCNKMMRVQISP